MNEVVHTSPTIGSNVEEVVWKNVHFIMWDLGGQESLRAAWNTYYSNTEVRPYFFQKKILKKVCSQRSALCIHYSSLLKVSSHFSVHHFGGGLD